MQPGLRGCKAYCMTLKIVYVNFVTVTMHAALWTHQSQSHASVAMQVFGGQIASHRNAYYACRHAALPDD